MILRATMHLAEINQLLPEILQRTVRPGSPLAALMDNMQALHVKDEEILAQLDAVFDPRRSRDDFVPLLAQWLDLGFLLERTAGEKLHARSSETISAGLGRLRELIANGAELSHWTGTAKGLRRFLHIATGANGIEIRENVDARGQSKPFHLTITAPSNLKPHQDLLARIIESEKPAYVTFELVFQSSTTVDL